jgi:hypothetical protein
VRVRPSIRKSGPDAAKHDDRGEPRQVAGAQRRFRRRNAEGGAAEMHRGEPDPGAQIKQPRKQLRRDLAEQQLRKRRRRPKQHSRRQRHRHARPERGLVCPRHAATGNASPWPPQTTIKN